MSERRTARKGAPLFGAAERALAREHRSDRMDIATGGSGGMSLSGGFSSNEKPDDQNRERVYTESATLPPNQPADPELAPEPENIDDDLASFTELGHSHLDHQSPFTPTPPPASITPESLAFPKPSPDCTPTAYVHCAAAEPAASRLKIVPIASFFPGIPARFPLSRSHKALAAKKTGERSRTTASPCRPATRPPISNTRLIKHATKPDPSHCPGPI